MSLVSPEVATTVFSAIGVLVASLVKNGLASLFSRYTK